MNGGGIDPLRVGVVGADFISRMPGGGPLYDMGPYYLHALITLLGPVARVSAASPRPVEERGLPPHSGRRGTARRRLDLSAAAGRPRAVPLVVN